MKCHIDKVVRAMVDVVFDGLGGMTITLVVNGEPVAQGRPRFSTHGKFVKAYDPQKSAGYKNLIQAYTQDVYKKVPDFKPFDSAIMVSIKVFRSIPKSLSKKARQAAAEGSLKPTTRPDVDNYIKGILDALNGVLWKDDARISYLSCEKLYSEQPRIEVKILSHSEAGT